MSFWAVIGLIRQVIELCRLSPINGGLLEKEIAAMRGVSLLPFYITYTNYKRRISSTGSSKRDHLSSILVIELEFLEQPISFC